MKKKRIMLKTVLITIKIKNNNQTLKMVNLKCYLQNKKAIKTKSTAKKDQINLTKTIKKKNKALIQSLNNIQRTIHPLTLKTTMMMMTMK